MPSNSFNIKILSPNKILFSGPVSMAIVPGDKGEFAILKNHIPFISTLKSGDITLINELSSKNTFQINGGVCSVMPSSVVCIVS